MTKKEKMKKLVVVEKYLEKIELDSSSAKECFSVIRHNLDMIRSQLFVDVDELEEKELIETYNTTVKEMEKEIEKIK